MRTVSGRPPRFPYSVARWLSIRVCIVALGSLLVAPLGAGEPMAEEAGPKIENARGTITQVGNFGFGIVPDSDPGTRYAPIEPLPERLRKDGLEVIFSGEVGSPDEGGGRGRRWGTPIRITHIAEAEKSDAMDASAAHH